ncbi:hypothetical protein BHE74_00002554, partial [Ensete ventricosum]
RRPSWGLRWFPAHGGRLISLGIRALKDEGYREAVDDEILTRCRLQVCREEGDREAVEKRLGFGQVEELIEESLENLNLIYEMIGPLLLWSPLSLPFCSLYLITYTFFFKYLIIEWEPWGVPEDYEYAVNTVSQTCLLTLTLLTPNGVLQDGRGSLSIKGLNLWLSRLKLCLSQELFSFGMLFLSLIGYLALVIRIMLGVSKNITCLKDPLS